MEKKEVFSLMKNLTEEWVGPASELGEIQIDSLLEEGIIKDIPVISTIFSVFKSINNFRDYLFARKLHQFLKNYHQNKTHEKYNKIRKQLEKIDREDLYIHLVSILERIIEDEKIKILNNLFSAFTDEEIGYDYFIDLSLILSSIHPRAISMLEHFSKSPTPFSFSIEDGKNTNFSLLSMSGLLNTINVWGGTKISINDFGQDLYKYGIKNR